MAAIKYFSFVLPLFIVSILQGQTKKSSDLTTFSIQVDYLSNYSYNGRVDSIKYPYQTTTASLHLANGLFSNFSASYLLTPGMKGFDFFELDSDPAVHIYIENNPLKSIDQITKVIEMIKKQYHESSTFTHGFQPFSNYRIILRNWYFSLWNYQKANYFSQYSLRNVYRLYDYG